METNKVLEKDKTNETYNEYFKRLYRKLEATPCFREPLMWGIACGVLAGIHKYRSFPHIKNAIVNACDYAVVGLGVSSTISWYICSKKRTYEENHVRMIMEGQGLRHISKANKEKKAGAEENVTTKNGKHEIDRMRDHKTS